MESKIPHAHLNLPLLFLFKGHGIKGHGMSYSVLVTQSGLTSREKYTNNFYQSCQKNDREKGKAEKRIVFAKRYVLTQKRKNWNNAPFCKFLGFFHNPEGVHI